MLVAVYNAELMIAIGAEIRIHFKRETKLVRISSANAAPEERGCREGRYSRAFDYSEGQS